MGLEPPPNVLRADRLRKQGIGRGIKTGAKTATKEQEREYLARFERLARDPDLALPQWRTQGPDPLARLRARFRRVHTRRDRPVWLKWLGRGRRLDHAYAQTLLALRAGKIPSFASLRFRDRDVKFVLRGRGLREKLAGLHNFDDPHVRLLAFVDVARKKRLALVSHEGAFFALREDDAVPPHDLQALLAHAELGLLVEGDGLRCPHAEEGSFGLVYELRAPRGQVRMCRTCVKRLEAPLATTLELGLVTRTGHIDVERRVVGRLHQVHPESAEPDYDALVSRAADAARRRMERYEGVSDVDLLAWTEEELAKVLQDQPAGFLQVGDELWLGDYDTAAARYGTDDAERAALAEAFRRSTPRTRAGDASFARLIDPAWGAHALELLRSAGGHELDPAALQELAKQRPAEAFSTLGRLLKNERRFAGYPRFGALPAPLRLAHDLFKAHRVGDSFQFQRRLAEGIRDAGTKPLALALARAFGQGAGVEWQFSPHEKDQALFFEPAAQGIARAGPEGYLEALGLLAEALQQPLPDPLPAAPAA